MYVGKYSLSPIREIFRIIGCIIIGSIIRNVKRDVVSLNTVIRSKLHTRPFKE